MILTFVLQAWPTPTPMPTSVATSVFETTFEGSGVELAEGVVQGYQQLNQAGVLEIFFLLVIVAILIYGIVSIVSRIQSL